MSTSGVTNEEAKEIFLAGQDLLNAIFHHLSDKGIETFDRHLADLYALAGIKHRLCDACDADAPEQLLTDKGCPRCQG